MEDLENNITKLNQMFEEGKNIRKPYIISHDQPLSDVSLDYIKNQEAKISDDIIETELRKAELSAIQNKKELQMLRDLEKSVIKINSIKNFLGTINIKAASILRNNPSINSTIKEDAQNLVDNFDKRINEQKFTGLKEAENLPNISSSQKIDSSKNSLIEIPQILLFKLKNFNIDKNKEVLFDLERENEQEKKVSKGQSRILKKNGSVFSSILITITTLTVGIVAAMIFLK